jgi:hypothetical protein
MYGFAAAPVTVEVDVSAATVSVAHQIATFTATGAAPSQDALVGGLGAAVHGSTTGGTPVVDVGGVDWGKPGVYDVTVGDASAHDVASRVHASIRVVPVPVVTLPAGTVYLPVSATSPVPAATVLANAGATLTDKYGNPLEGTLTADTSAVNGSAVGTYAATITGTDAYGFTSAPATVQVVVYVSAMQTGTVAISGTPVVGATLTAVRAGWIDLATPSYQWLRDGVPIAGATGEAYTVSADDAGHRLSVRVTEAPSWYLPVAATSDAVAVPDTVAVAQPAPPTVPTAPATGASVTPAPKLSGLSYKSGSVRLMAKVTGKGTLTIKITIKSGGWTIVLGTRKVSVSRAQTVAASVKLTASAKSRIRRATLKATVTATFTPSAKGAKPIAAHHALTIRKGAR